jgi:hypothetical protein
LAEIGSLHLRLDEELGLVYEQAVPITQTKDEA